MYVTNDIYLRASDILPRLIVHNKHVRGFHELFLHARRSQIDVIVMLDGDASAGACNPAKAVELVAERADVVRGVQRIGRSDERIVAACLHLCFLHVWLGGVCIIKVVAITVAG